jgi:predicted DsbA family dithiol-disulfide isomerase
MTTHLKIDFVSDVACPWCAIGLHSLEEALRRTTGVVEAELCFQPFELNPHMPIEGVNHDVYLAQRLGATPEQLAGSRAMVRERAASVGFAFNVSERSRIYNTFDAHRLLHWARSVGRQRELKHLLFKANFTDDQDISNADVLITTACLAGLDPVQAREVLNSGRHAQDVRQTEQLWLSRGIQSVPAIVINAQWLIAGGQPPEVFEQALRNIATELAPTSAKN